MRICRSIVALVSFLIVVGGVGEALAQLKVAKTVSTTDSCPGASSSLAVLPGSTVYYCYCIESGINATRGNYTVEDDQLGIVGNRFLPPANTTDCFSVPFVVNATVTNNANWTVLRGGLAGTAAATVTLLANETVPTLSDFGILALGLGIAGAAFAFLRSRRI